MCGVVLVCWQDDYDHYRHKKRTLEEDPKQDKVRAARSMHLAIIAVRHDDDDGQKDQGTEGERV